MTAHPFLSPEWIAAVAAIRDEYHDRVGPTEVSVRANVTVTEAPFDEPTVEGHVDTSAGVLTIDEGHLADSDFQIEVRYELAHQLFVGRDPQAILSALLGGQVKLTGDSSKVLGIAGIAAPPPDDSPTASLAREVIGRIDAVTLKDL